MCQKLWHLVGNISMHNGLEIILNIWHGIFLLNLAAPHLPQTRPDIKQNTTKQFSCEKININYEVC